MLPFPAVQLGFAHVWGTQGSSGLALCSVGPQGLTGPVLCTVWDPRGSLGPPSAHVWGPRGSSGPALCTRVGPQGLTGPALCTRVGPQGFIWAHPLHAGKAVLTQGSFRGGVQRKLFRERPGMFFRIALSA